MSAAQGTAGRSRKGRGSATPGELPGEADPHHATDLPALDDAGGPNG